MNYYLGREDFLFFIELQGGEELCKRKKLKKALFLEKHRIN